MKEINLTLHAWGTVKNVREIGINPISRYYKEFPLNSGPEDYSVRTDFCEPSLSHVIISNVPNIFRFRELFSRNSIFAISRAP